MKAMESKTRGSTSMNYEHEVGWMPFHQARELSHNGMKVAKMKLGLWDHTRGVGHNYGFASPRSQS